MGTANILSDVPVSGPLSCIIIGMALYIPVELYYPIYHSNNDVPPLYSLLRYGAYGRATTTFPASDAFQFIAVICHYILTIVSITYTP